MSVNFARSATVRANSYDPKTRTFRAIASTGADVNRGSYIERLPVDAINVASLVGKPLIDSHATGSVLATVGKVLSAERTADGIEVTAQLLDSPDVAPFAARLEAGVIPGVSIGFRGHLGQPVAQRTGLPIRTLSNVVVSELSLTMNPADPGAVVRSNPMPDNILPTNQPTNTPPVNSPDLATFCRSHGVADEEIARLASLGTTVEDVMPVLRQRALSALQSSAAPAVRVTNVTPVAGHMQQRDAMASALACRMNGTAPEGMAREFMGMSVVDMARSCLGTDAGRMTPDEVITRSMAMGTTSDFPLLMSTATNRVLLDSYQAASSPIRTALAKSATQSDFKGRQVIKMTGMGPLAPLSESGEITATSMGEVAEGYRLKTFARMFNLSRQLILGDNLGGLADFSRQAGRSAAEMEANEMVNLLLSNPVMGEDGVKMFHAKHGNLAATGTALSVDSLSAGRLAMRKQKNLDGRTPAAVTPAFLVVGPELETVANQVLSSIYANSTEAVNPFAGKLQMYVEARIPDASWYLFAAPTVWPVLEYSYLASAPGPQVSSQLAFEQLGLKQRIYEDFGCGVLDFRGAYFNPGAAA